MTVVWKNMYDIHSRFAMLTPPIVERAFLKVKECLFWSILPLCRDPPICYGPFFLRKDLYLLTPFRHDHDASSFLCVCTEWTDYLCSFNNSTIGALRTISGLRKLGAPWGAYCSNWPRGAISAPEGRLNFPSFSWDSERVWNLSAPGSLFSHLR